MPELQNEPLSFEKVWASLMETKERQEKTDRQIQENNRQIGKLGNRFGDLIVQATVPDTSFLGHKPGAEVTGQG